VENCETSKADVLIYCEVNKKSKRLWNEVDMENCESSKADVLIYCEVNKKSKRLWFYIII
jgi:hypothetical protein